jgi:hypothetical protein
MKKLSIVLRWCVLSDFSFWSVEPQCEGGVELFYKLTHKDTPTWAGWRTQEERYAGVEDTGRFALNDSSCAADLNSVVQGLFASGIPLEAVQITKAKLPAMAQ